MANPVLAPNFSVLMEQLNQLPLDFRGAANVLSEQLITEVTSLQDLQSSIASELAALATLHNVTTVEEGTLDGLIEQYQANAKNFSQAFSQRQEELELALETAQQAWVQAQQEQDRMVSDRNTHHRKQTQREQQEYIYNRDLARKLTDEGDEQTQQERDRALAELQETQEQQWADREKELADREKELADLQSQVDAMPKTLEQSTQKAKAEGKAIAESQAKVKADLIAAETEGRKRSYGLRITSLEATIATQTQRLTALSAQLDAALKQVQDLAVKAIEGSSNANALQDMKEIAMEQAKTLGKGK